MSTQSPEPKAYHNAGHAVATALIEREHASDAPCDNPHHHARWNAEYEVMTALAGVIAERMFVGEVDATGATNDISHAFRHVGALTQIPGEQAAYVAFLNARVEHLLERNRAFIEHTASAVASSDRPANDVAREFLPSDRTSIERA